MTVSGDNREHFLVTIFPANENSRSTAALVAGTAKIRLAILAKRGYNYDCSSKNVKEYILDHMKKKHLLGKILLIYLFQILNNYRAYKSFLYILIYD